MIRIPLKIILILFFIFLNSCSCQKDQKVDQNKPKKYNLVFLCIDNLRSDHLGLYGYKRKTAPFFDKWAETAQVFENFYSSAHMTIPSEGSVFTGRYPFEHGLISFEHMLWPQVETVTSVLSKKGFKTLAYGNSPEYITFPSVRASFEPLFDKYKIVTRAYNNRLLKPKIIGNFLDNIGDDNFFIWIPMGTVHSPYGFPFEHTFSDKFYKGPLKKFENFPGSNFWVYKNILYSITAETNFNFANFNSDLINNAESEKINLKSSDLDWVTDRYDDGIRVFDNQFKAIMNLFEKRNLLNNTIFVIYSSHGEELNEHGYFGHFDVYQGNINTPLVIKAPNLTVGKRIKLLASSIDILPTVLKLMDIEAPDKMDGLNLFSTEAENRKDIYILRTPLWESLLRVKDHKSIWDDFRTKIATEDYMEPVIITEKFKLIHRRARFILKKYSAFQKISKQQINFPEYEMYDLIKDPLEQINIADQSKDFNSLNEKLINFEKKILSKKNIFKKQNTMIEDYR